MVFVSVKQLDSVLTLLREYADEVNMRVERARSHTGNDKETSPAPPPMPARNSAHSLSLEQLLRMAKTMEPTANQV